jgi:Rps23 Pro-64 3,4-dihydroxylase Tpa1-like proline 4-hydroxylase
MLNYDFLETNLDRYKKSFAEAKPHRHLIIDNFLDLELATTALHFFPAMSEMDMLKDFRQYKAQDPNLNKFHPIFQQIIFEHLHSHRFLNTLSQITGMSDLLPDDRLYAAGLAQGGDRSFLNVHIDNSSHPVQQWYRRIDLLIYLNKDWTEENGGHLELWNPEMSESVKILPIFNRMVIFATDRQFWHGYRQVNTKDGNTRKSINIYYFTAQSPDGTDYHHVTSFKARQQELVNKVLYPVDNLVRTVVRSLRPKKDDHAVLFTHKKEP